MQIIPLRPGDRVRLRKPHPCGGDTFRILRVGGDVRVICETCGRDMTVDRIKLEKAIRDRFPAEETEQQKGTGNE